MNYKTKNNYKKINIENIINQRLKLQSVQRQLKENLNVQGLNSAAQLKSIKFLDYFAHLDEKTKKNFLSTIAGNTNHWEAINYITQTIKELQPKIALLVCA